MDRGPAEGAHRANRRNPDDPQAKALMRGLRKHPFRRTAIAERLPCRGAHSSVCPAVRSIRAASAPFSLRCHAPRVVFETCVNSVPSVGTRELLVA